MLVPALLVAFAYWITWLIDGILGWQTMTRPIVVAEKLWECTRRRSMEGHTRLSAISGRRDKNKLPSAK